MENRALSREEILCKAAEFDANAAHSEELRAGFSSALWIAEGMLRDGLSRQDERAVADARVSARNARRFADQCTVRRDRCAAHALELRESLGDYVPAAALSPDYRLRYAAASSPSSTSATLIHLGQDTSTLVAAEAAATWEARHPGRTLADVLRAELTAG